jgi:lipopolysaccharide export system permease protein
MAVAARKVRGGIGVHLALGIALGGLYVVVSRFAIVFATGEAVPVLLGIWMPNLLFGSVAWYMIGKAQK